MKKISTQEFYPQQIFYDYYSAHKRVKEVWDALTKKYDNKEVGNKFDLNCYFKCQMIDVKSVEAQSHEITKFADEIIIEVMVLVEQFQVDAIINKPPPT